MRTDRKSARALWAVSLALMLWIAVTAPFSVAFTAWGLSGFCLGLAIARWFLSDRSTLAVRQRAVDVSILAAFTLALAFLALAGRFG